MNVLCLLSVWSDIIMLVVLIYFNVQLPKCQPTMKQIPLLNTKFCVRWVLIDK